MELNFRTKSPRNVGAIVNESGIISLDLPTPHLRPYQRVLTVYPPLIALALNSVETDIK